MTIDHSYADTPSITDKTITAFRAGERLTYDKLTALEKRDYLFDQGIRPTAYGAHAHAIRPDVKTGLLRFGASALQSLATGSLGMSLTRLSDELEEPKRKLFHTYGTTAKVVFAPERDTPYSGLFGQRAHGLARFSYAGPTLSIGIVPGLALKFPIDGDHPSANLVVMRKLDPQQPITRVLSNDTHNSVFQNAFTNVLPTPHAANVTMRIVKERFETVVADGKGLHQSVEGLAAVTTSGAIVERENINAPFRLIFSPTRQAAERSDPTIDFRDDLATNITVGTPIYDVFALTEAEERELNRSSISEVEDLLAHSRKIGTVTTESEFIASSYGDYRLFFQHDARFIRPGISHSTARP